MGIGIIMSAIRKKREKDESSNCRFHIVKKYEGCIKVIVLLMLLLHWPKFNASIIGVDTESLIWDETGYIRAGSTPDAGSCIIEISLGKCGF